MVRCPKLAVLRLVCAALACGVSLSAQAEPTFPYAAYANADNVQVRSGPGENYYPTAALPRGAAVEVYRHDPGGWYAVRPPDGSFSWVQAENVQPQDDRIVVVESPRAAARVGSQLSDIRDVIQVHLERGEQLQVLGAKTFGNKTWYKIAPPAGEFRWVYGRFLSQQPTDQQPPTDTQAPPPHGVERADGASGHDGGDVELAGLWPKRGGQGQGLWKKRAPQEAPPAEEFAQRQPDRWWQRHEPRQPSRREREWEDSKREYPADDEPYVEGPYGDEPYIVYEDGPPDEEWEDQRSRRGGPSVYDRDGPWDTARARLSPHLRELADAEARDGDAEEPYPGMVIEREAPRDRPRSYDRFERRERDGRDDEYDRSYSTRDRRRGYERDDRRREDDYAYDDRRRREDDYAYDDRRPEDVPRDDSQRGSFKVRLPSRGRSEGAGGGELAGDLDWLDMELSTLVVEEAPPAEYDDLRERAEELLAKSTTPLERGQARLMMEKIDRFAELTDRNVSLARRTRDRKPASRTARRSAPSLDDGAVTGDNALRAKAGRYDGVGKLTAVVSERPGSPAYALLDERGKVQCYVTPAPGVNLRHYVGQEVGLNGSVGFNPDLSRRQVVAQRITPLDDGPVRR